jgi:hypothetical protein
MFREKFFGRYTLVNFTLASYGPQTHFASVKQLSDISWAAKFRSFTGHAASRCARGQVNPSATRRAVRFMALNAMAPHILIFFETHVQQ